MARPQDIVDALIVSLKNNTDITSEATFIGFEPDGDTQPINLPIVQVDPDGDMNDETLVNSQFVEFAKDDDGNDIGRIFERLFRLELTVAVWTAQRSSFDPRAIADEVRVTLFEHETSGPAEDLVLEDGTVLDEVWQFDVGTARQADDLSTSPPLRRWEQDITVSSGEQFVSLADEATVKQIDQDVTITEADLSVN
jgi:hypothetical protein